MTLREFTKEAVSKEWVGQKVLKALKDIRRAVAKAKSIGLKSSSLYGYADPKLEQASRLMGRLAERAAK